MPYTLPSSDPLLRAAGAEPKKSGPQGPAAVAADLAQQSSIQRAAQGKLQAEGMSIIVRECWRT